MAADTKESKKPLPSFMEGETGENDMGLLTILHTSDWHLGQKFMGKSREDEHRAFLQWLTETIDQHGVDMLIVSGDIFDTGTPPNYALELYYSFLTQLQHTSCRTVVIVAGNHDSIATLNAPKEILRLLNIYVVSSGDEDEETIVPIYKNNKLAGLVCAVPFLRDGIVRKGVSGESLSDKEKALVEGIESYYRDIHAKALEAIEDEGIPIIATGHFTTVGGKTSDSERDIYIGNTMNIPSGFLAEMFDYVALGHLHRSQTVGYDHVRYSGSPIPLSFSEADDQKKVTLVTFDEEIPLIEEINIPSFRNLYRIKGNKDTIMTMIAEIKDTEGWIEVEITDSNTYAALQSIQEYADAHDLTILAKKITRNLHTIDIEEEEVVNLEEVTPLDIFMKRLELDNIEDETFAKKLISEFKTIENKVVVS
jgi:exonuclease SbcD